MFKIVRPALLCTFMSVLGSGNALAQAAAHWSTFDKPASDCACHLFARSAFANERMKILEDASSGIIANNDKVFAHLVCKPAQKQVFIIAFSADSAAAEKVRNNVREHIVKARLFDTCP